MEVSGRDRLTLLAIVMLPMLVWWAAFYPGTFTNDSLTVINQIRSGNWDDWHTNAYTAFVWLTSLSGNYWAMTTLAQVALMSLGIASLATAFIKQGIPRTIVLIASALFAASPQVGAFAITLWKDVPSAAGALMLAASMVNLRPSDRSKAEAFMLLAGGALLVGSFRWNGPVALVIISVILVVLYRKQVLRATAVILGMGIVSMASLILPQRLNLAASTASTIVNVTELHDIAYAYTSDQSSIDESGKSLLGSIMPLENWLRGGSTCETVDVLLFENIDEFAPQSREAIHERRGKLRNLWLSVIRNSPSEVATTRFCRAAGVWSPLYFGKQPTLGLAYLHSNDPELGRPGYFPSLERMAIRAVTMTSSSELRKSLALNAMLWTLIAIAVVFALRNRPVARLYLKCLPVSIAVMVSVMLGAVAHDARYVASALLLAQFFVAVAVLDSIRHRISVTRSRRA